MISMDKKLDTYGTKCYVGVSTWLHVLAVISQLRRVLPQPQLAMRSRRIYASPQRRHHGQAEDTLPPAPHLPMLYATGSSRSLSRIFSSQQRRGLASIHASYGYGFSRVLAGAAETQCK